MRKIVLVLLLAMSLFTGHAIAASFIVLESGDRLLMENGNSFLLEGSINSTARSSFIFFLFLK